MPKSTTELTPGMVLEILQSSSATLLCGCIASQPRELFAGVEEIELSVNESGNLEIACEFPEPALNKGEKHERTESGHGV